MYNVATVTVLIINVQMMSSLAPFNSFCRCCYSNVDLTLKCTFSFAACSLFLRFLNIISPFFHSLIVLERTNKNLFMSCDGKHQRRPSSFVCTHLDTNTHTHHAHFACSYAIQFIYSHTQEQKNWRIAAHQSQALSGLPTNRQPTVKKKVGFKCLANICLI